MMAPLVPMFLMPDTILKKDSCPDKQALKKTYWMPPNYAEG